MFAWQSQYVRAQVYARHVHKKHALRCDGTYLRGTMIAPLQLNIDKHALRCDGTYLRGRVFVPLQQNISTRSAAAERIRVGACTCTRDMFAPLQQSNVILSEGTGVGGQNVLTPTNTFSLTKDAPLYATPEGFSKKIVDGSWKSRRHWTSQGKFKTKNYQGGQHQALELELVTWLVKNPEAKLDNFQPVEEEAKAIWDELSGPGATAGATATPAAAQKLPKNGTNLLPQMDDN
eukprot:g4903.t1